MTNVDLPAVNKWVFINESTLPTQDGKILTNDMLLHIAQAVEVQLNSDYSTECGEVVVTIRVGSKESIQPDEQVFSFVDSFPSAALKGASAYHDVEGDGKVASYCAVTTCADAYGPAGVGVDASHEVLEAAGNPGCNQFVDDGFGWMHARERCDAIEIQSYPIAVKGAIVFVSNFLLDSWFIPDAKPPYTFTTKVLVPGAMGALDPSGPLLTAKSPSGKGNYQVEYFVGKAPKAQTVLAMGAPAPSESVDSSPSGARLTRRPLSMIYGSPKNRVRVEHASSRFSRIRDKNDKKADRKFLPPSTKPV